MDLREQQIMRDEVRAIREVAEALREVAQAIATAGEQQTMALRDIAQKVNH